MDEAGLRPAVGRRAAGPVGQRRAGNDRQPDETVRRHARRASRQCRPAAWLPRGRTARDRRQGDGRHSPCRRPRRQGGPASRRPDQANWRQQDRNHERSDPQTEVTGRGRGDHGHNPAKRRRPRIERQARKGPMKLRRALIVPLLLALPVSAEMPKVVTVPFEMLQADKLISGHLAVQVRINGKGPYRLVFDTGAPVILLSTRVGKEAGLIGPKGNAKANGLLPGQVKVGKLEVGGVVAEDLQAMVFDHPTVKAIAEIFGPVDGIVGFPFFARYRTAIDYQAKTLTFAPSGYKPGDVIQKLMTTMLRPRRAADGPRV